MCVCVVCCVLCVVCCVFKVYSWVMIIDDDDGVIIMFIDIDDTIIMFVDSFIVSIVSDDWWYWCLGSTDNHSSVHLNPIFLSTLISRTFIPLSSWRLTLEMSWSILPTQPSRSYSLCFVWDTLDHREIKRHVIFLLIVGCISD